MYNVYAYLNKKKEEKGEDLSEGKSINKAVLEMCRE